LYLKFAWRYFIAKKSTNAINIISWITIVVIAVVTWAMVVVLSVFNGFEDLVKSLYGDFFTDIKVVPIKGKLMQVNTVQWQQIQQLPTVRNMSGVVEEKVILMNNDFQANAYLKGVDGNYMTTSGVAKHVARGNAELGDTTSPKLLLGAGVENAIGVQSDRNLFPITINMPNGKAQRKEDAIRSFNVGTCGTFLIQQDFDNKYAITNINFMRYMLDMKSDEYSALEIAMNKGVQENDLKKKVTQILGSNYKVLTKYEQNQSLFSVMQIEKWVIFAILIIILIVAAFNMIGALTMLVLEKQKDIGVLKALGSHTTDVQKIFLAQGFILAAVGAIIGAVLGLFTCWLQMKFHLVKLGGGSFVIDYYPVKILLTDMLAVALVIALIALLASWIPSRKAADQGLELRS
jgi:lipoprotein-releasing system permease protein